MSIKKYIVAAAIVSLLITGKAIASASQPSDNPEDLPSGLLQTRYSTSNAVTKGLKVESSKCSTDDIQQNIPFADDMEDSDHIHTLKTFLNEKICQNPQAYALLLDSLGKNKNLRVTFFNDASFGEGCFKLENEEIRLNIHRYVNSLKIGDEISGIFKNYILRVFIFELANSVNAEVLNIRASHFKSGEDFARAVEIAEFHSSEISWPIYITGKRDYAWDETVFATSDLNVMRNIAYTSKDDHYLRQVAFYNSHWLEFKLTYYAIAFLNFILN